MPKQENSNKSLLNSLKTHHLLCEMKILKPIFEYLDLKN